MPVAAQRYVHVPEGGYSRCGYKADLALNCWRCLCTFAVMHSLNRQQMTFVWQTHLLQIHSCVTTTRTGVASKNLVQDLPAQIVLTLLSGWSQLPPVLQVMGCV